MDVQNLRFFVETVRRGSFAAVARAHGIAPSSVSRAIAGLEAELGFGLFDRTTRRLAPTEAGEIYFARVEDLVDDLEQAAELAGGSSREPRGTLRVLAPVSFSQLNLLPILPEFLERHPRIELDLVLTDEPLDLVDARVDVAIRLGPLADSSHVARRLTGMRPRVCASPAYLERHGRPATPEDLAHHTCLLLDMPGFGNRWFFGDTRGEVFDVDVHGPVRTSNAIALKQLALDGVGVILQGDWIVGREIADGSLVDLFPDLECTASSFGNAAWTLRPKRSYEAKKVRVFVEWLHGRFAQGAPWAGPRTDS